MSAKKRFHVLNKRINERVARIDIHVTNKWRYASATAVARGASSQGSFRRLFISLGVLLSKFFNQKQQCSNSLVKNNISDGIVLDRLPCS